MTYSDNPPIFNLYGEQADLPKLDRLHCETIASRSKLYDWHIRLHRHASLYQVLYLHSGNATVHFEQNKYNITGPAIVEIPQSFIHGFEFNRKCIGYVLTISYPLINGLINHLGPSSSLPKVPLLTLSKSINNAEKLKTAFSELTNTYLSTKQFRTAQAEAWFTIIYTELRLLNPTIKTAEKNSAIFRHFNRFINLIEENYPEQHMVSWYANKMNITSGHLHIIVRSHSNKSPLQLIHDRINLEANRSLIYTTMKISEISYSLGFLEPAHFSRFFQRQNNTSPRKFREQIINQNAQ